MSNLSTPDEKPDQSQSVRVMAYLGPLPPPSQLAQYEQIVPGGAERIFKRFESQSENRQKLESSVVHADNFVQILGAITASIIGIVGVAGGLFLVYAGHNLEGFSAFLLALSTLSAAFVYGQKSNKR